MNTVLFLAKNLRTSIEVCGGALPWCNIHDSFFHNSVCFLRITSSNRYITLRWYSILTLLPSGKNSREFRRHDFLILALLNASIRMIGLWCQLHRRTPMIRHLFEQIRIIVESRQYFMCGVKATLFLPKI